MDPLSVAASVVGLLTAAGKMAQLLGKLTAMADAPALARVVLAEMKDITVALGHLQEYLNGTNDVNSDRKRFIQLEHVVATLTGAVTTYSELEAIIIAIRIDPTMSAFDRLKWSNKESEIRDIVQRMQNHKTSLILMLSILQSKSSQEVESSQQRLCNLVEQVVASNRDLSARLCRLETQSFRKSIENDLPFMTAVHGDAHARRSAQHHASGFSPSFERFLHTSRVYEHCHFQHSETSLTSSTRRANAFSTFTSLSLADVSNISVFSLPIHASDVSNGNWYTFGLSRHRGFSETVHIESVHSRTVANSTLNQNSNPSGRLETENDAEMIDRRAAKPRNHATNQERLLFQSVRRRAEDQQAIQRVNYQEAQTSENFPTNHKLEKQPQLVNRPTSDNEETQIPESPQASYDLGEQHHVAKSTLLTVLRSLAPTSLALLYKFETHARTCVSCHDPYKVYRLGKRLCDEGHELAQKIAGLLYKYPVEHKDSIEIEDLQLQSHLFPPDYVQVRGLLRATEEFLHDARQKRKFRPRATDTQLLRFRDKELRSRDIIPRQSTHSLTDSIPDCGSNPVGKTSQSQRPRASNRVSYHSDRNRASFPQLDYRRQSTI